MHNGVLSFSGKDLDTSIHPQMTYSISYKTEDRKDLINRDIKFPAGITTMLLRTAGTVISLTVC
jgi:hypothetical protein